MSMMIAQALVERGMLEGAIVGMLGAFDTVVTVLLDHPLSVLVIAALVGVLLFSRRD
jgi:hypothetical protein